MKKAIDNLIVGISIIIAFIIVVSFFKVTPPPERSQTIYEPSPWELIDSLKNDLDSLKNEQQ